MSRNKAQAPAGSLFQIFISETNAEPPELLGQSVTKGRSGPLLPAVWVGPLVSGMSTSASSWPDPGPVQEGLDGAMGGAVRPGRKVLDLLIAHFLTQKLCHTWDLGRFQGT